MMSLGRKWLNVVQKYRLIKVCLSSYRLVCTMKENKQLSIKWITTKAFHFRFYVDIFGLLKA